MPAEMIACPHCGTENSKKKQICYNCLKKIAPPKPSVSARMQQAIPRVKVRPNAPKKKLSSKLSSALLGATLRQRAQVYRELYSLLNAGIPAGLALHHVAANCAYQLKPIFARLSKYVHNGALLTDGMREFPNVFPEWEISVVQAAEKSGTLPRAMRDIAETQEMEWDLRSRTNSATFHLKGTAWVAVLVMLIVRAAGSANGDVWGKVGGSFIFFLWILLGFWLLKWAWAITRRTYLGGRIASQIAPRIPLVGSLIQNMIRIRFVRVLSTLWGAGVAPMEALEVAARTTDNTYFIRQVQQLSGQFSEGVQLSTILEQTHFLPNQALYLLQTGETTGSVASALDKIAEYYQIELDAQVKTLPAKLQLLFYAVLVPVVGYIVISFWTKYFGSMLGGG